MNNKDKFISVVFFQGWLGFVNKNNNAITYYLYHDQIIFTCNIFKIRFQKMLMNTLRIHTRKYTCVLDIQR